MRDVYIVSGVTRAVCVPRSASRLRERLLGSQRKASLPVSLALQRG